MEVAATAKYVRISPTKARDLACEIKGLPVASALKVTEFNSRKAAFYLGKTLKSAIANAENNEELSAERLYVKEAVINEGPTLKRFWPRSKGMVSPVKKRSSHITVVLSDEKPVRK